MSYIEKLRYELIQACVHCTDEDLLDLLVKLITQLD